MSDATAATPGADTANDTASNTATATEAAAKATAAASAASERAMKAARDAANVALGALKDLTQSVREQAAALAERVRPQLSSAADYAKEQPAKTLLVSAALGAAVVGLYLMLTRTGGSRHDVALRPSLKAQLGDAANDALDAARGSVSEAVGTLRDTAESLRGKAAAATERLREPLDAATDYAKEDPIKAVLIAAVAGAVAMALIAAVVSSQRDE